MRTQQATDNGRRRLYMGIAVDITSWDIGDDVSQTVGMW